jgi:hypothetical protein
LVLLLSGAAKSPTAAFPQISTLAVDIYVGWLFLLSGIFGILTMFLARDMQAFLWMLLTAALSLFVGVMLILASDGRRRIAHHGANRLLHRRRRFPDRGLA